MLAASGAPLEVARAAGVPISFGSDLIGEPDSNQREAFRFRSCASCNTHIIRSVTLVSHEVFQGMGELGIIVPGAFADALLWPSPIPISA